MTTQKALSASSAFPVYRDTMSGRLFCGDTLATYLRDMFGGSFCVSDYVTAGMLAPVDTSHAHAVRLAASVVYDFCDPYEIADTFCDFEICTIEDAEKHAVKVTADYLYQAGENASAVYEYIANMYGEQDDGDETVKLVQLMDEMQLFIKARTLQKKCA